MRVYIVDLASGNLRSVAQAVRRVAPEACLDVGRDPAAVGQAERIILPGVGAFAALASRLFAEPQLVAALEMQRAAGVPILGICVGMQLMAEIGLEHGRSVGLGWIGGQVEALAQETQDPDQAVPHSLRVPRMGWSLVTPTRGNPLLPAKEWFYFAHGFAFAARDSSCVLATTRHARPADTPALIGDTSPHRVWGAQFHPEKSGAAGMAFLARFLSPVVLA